MITVWIFYEKQGWAYPGGNAVNVAVYGRQLGMDAAYLAGSAQTILGI